MPPKLAKRGFSFKPSLNLRTLGKLISEKPNLKCLLWCDPNDNDSATKIIEACASRQIQLIRTRTTSETLAKYRELESQGITELPEKYFRIMSNMVRPSETNPKEMNYTAGLDLCTKLREGGYNGPFMTFCGNVDRALQTFEESGSIIPNCLITSNMDQALKYAKFFTAHNLLEDDAGCLRLFPDFDRLLTEPLFHMVEGGLRPFPLEMKERTTEEITEWMGQCCIKKKIPRLNLMDPTPKKVQYRKFYIPRMMVQYHNNNLASQLFHMVEGVVYRFCRMGPLEPTIERVIAIDNPRLRAQFQRAANEMEQNPALGAWPAPANDDDKMFNGILQSALMNTTTFTKARPALVLHGTHDYAESVICSEGFRKEFLGGNTGNNGWYGAGLYFTTVATYANYHASDRVADGAVGEICFVVALALIGRPHFQKKIEMGRPCEPGCTSHYSVTTLTRPALEQPGQIDGDEIVLFDERLVTPLFVVEMSKH